MRCWCAFAAVFRNIVRVRFGEKEQCVYAFLDQGSIATICERSMFESLGTSGFKKSLVLRTLTSAQDLRAVAVSLSARWLDSGEWIDLPEEIAVVAIPVKPNVASDTTAIRKYRYL